MVVSLQRSGGKWHLFELLVPLQDLRDQIIFRLVPESVPVIAISYYQQRVYDRLIGALRRKLVH